jgi:hypothetical protein
MEERFLILGAAFAVLVLMSAIAARSFPKGAMVPMQWGLTGKPTWYAPLWFAVSFTPALAAIILALTTLLPLVSQKAQADFPRAFPAIIGVFLFVHVVHLSCAYWHFAARKR